MSLILFFGLSTLIVLVGFILVILTIHHHWKQWRLKVADEKKT